MTNQNLQPGDYIFIWTSFGYEPQMEVIKSGAIAEYFSSAMGYDEEDEADIRAMESGDVYQEFNGLRVVRA